MEISAQSWEEPLSDLPDRAYSIWCLSLTAAAAIGLTGIIPILFIPFMSQDDQASKEKLKLMLSFSVGGLLGDVFLHLLPEAWMHVYASGSSHYSHLVLGLWVVSGISTFRAIEMIFTLSEASDEKKEVSIQPSIEKLKDIHSETNGKTSVTHNKVGAINQTNGSIRQNDESNEEESPVSVTAYLSVFANGVDNFTHGLAIAASFSAGIKIGILTTFAILIHEIPHEFGDFAILMKSGFSRWRAVQAQVITAIVAMFGAFVGLLAQMLESEVGSSTRWILPYSAGCFLYIAMSNILPDLLREDNPKESLKQLFCISTGVLIMGLVNRIEDTTFIPFL